MTTDARVEPRPAAAAATRAAARRRAPRGPDRLSVAVFTLAAFLTVLALLAMQVRAGVATPAHRVIVVRRIYRTTVITTITGGSGPTGTSVTQSQSSSSAPSTAYSAPTTRTS